MPDQKSALMTRPSPFLRPHTAVGAKHAPPDTNNDDADNDLSKQSTFRPWTTHPRQRGVLSAQKVIRQSQQLRPSHLQALGAGGGGKKKRRRRKRQQESDAVKSALAFPVTGSGSDGEDGADGAGLDVVTVIGSSKGMTKDGSDESAQTKDGSRRGRHLSFDTWVSGSPHDSDEYNTDLEESDKKIGTQPRPQIDASGVNVYEEQCRKHGFVPVSYLRRHLDKRSIRMRHHYLGGNAARPLAYAFRHNTVTETVDLSDNYLESSGAVCLAAMLRDNTFIMSLNLSNNFIGSYGCAALAEMLDVNTTLKTLNLSGNQLNDADAHHFIEPLKNNMSLSSLDLSHNNLAQMAGVHLAAALNVNDGVNDLDLSWNSIRKDGAVALANSLKVNTSLEVLDLSWNGMGAEGSAALQQSLQGNNTLKVLDLTNNRIDTKSAVKLAAGLRKNFGLETVILNLNPICDEGIEAVLSAAAVHPNLKFLSLEELGISMENLQRIQELEQERGLIVLHGGAGGYQRNSSLMSVLRLFGRFSREHMTDLESAFQQQDKDRAGILTAEETKQCLRMAGLRLTSLFDRFSPKPKKTWGWYHGGRRPSSDDSFHSPTVIPPSRQTEYHEALPSLANDERQLDLIIDEIDFSHSGRIQYQEILSGKVFEEYHKRRPSRGFALTSALSKQR